MSNWRETMPSIGEEEENIDALDYFHQTPLKTWDQILKEACRDIFIYQRDGDLYTEMREAVDRYIDNSIFENEIAVSTSIIESGDTLVANAVKWGDWCLDTSDTLARMFPMQNLNTDQQLLLTIRRGRIMVAGLKWYNVVNANMYTGCGVGRFNDIGMARALTYQQMVDFIMAPEVKDCVEPQDMDPNPFFL